MDSDLHVLVLTIGKEIRMKSSLPKALHPLCEKPILQWVLSVAQELTPLTLTTVVDAIDGNISTRFEGQTDFVILESDHSWALSPKVFQNKSGNLLVIPGDAPLLSVQTLKNLIQSHRESGSACSVLAAILPDAESGIRIAGDDINQVQAIREAGDTPRDELKLREVHSGVTMFDLAVLYEKMERFPSTSFQNEVDLGDLVEIFRADGHSVNTMIADNPIEVMRIHTRVDLARARRVLQERIIRQWMLQGVTVHEPERVYIGPNVRLEPDVTLHSDVTLAGDTTIASGCSLYPYCYIENSQLKNNVRVEYSVIRDSEIQSGTVVGPFAHVRANTVIGPENRIGNFVEVKKSTTGSNTKAAHLAYLGDAEIGDNVNVGAGAITCNYDGVKKNPTFIEDDVFIGSDSILIAPLRIGQGAYIGAGSVITHDVPEESLSVSRPRQRNIVGWARKRNKKQKNS